MKTAISLPDEIFDAAEALARDSGLSRSELHARAVREYVDRQRRESVTARLNEVYADDRGALDPLLERMQLASLEAEDW